eukprot:TRINITY_DN4123_c0_g2_i2.p1 TRINITY_DN4123_c0_g2~~TRINITY_DN4123_c0_g2_i2.p1  ORF type:complete len:208 (-),score=27.80 TRINITY_DN4123_c0_g2_i2:322-945(-)
MSTDKDVRLLEVMLKTDNLFFLSTFLLLVVHSTFYYLGFYKYFVTFFLGVVWTIITGPPVCFLLYKLYFDKDLTDPSDEPGRVITRGVKFSGDDEKILVDEQIMVDISSKSEISGMIEIELGGKKKTRSVCFAALRGPTLFWQVKDKISFFLLFIVPYDQVLICLDRSYGHAIVTAVFLAGVCVWFHPVSEAEGERRLNLSWMCMGL